MIGFWVLVAILVIWIIWKNRDFILGLLTIIAFSIYVIIDEKIELAKKRKVIELIKKMQKSVEISGPEKIILILGKMNFSTDDRCRNCDYGECQSCESGIFTKIYSTADNMIKMDPKKNREALFDNFSLLKKYANDYEHLPIEKISA